MTSLKKYILLLLLLFCIYQTAGEDNQFRPVVLWHGMGDSCCFSFSLGGIKRLIEKTLPNVYVYSIRLGNNVVEDVEHGYFGNINEQISEVCEQLSKDEHLKGGYNAIGFSQGAQFLRAVIQRCPNPPVFNYISLGGQHQGVFGFPNCDLLGAKLCTRVTHIIKYGAYLNMVQKGLVQATYWHDPYQEGQYKNKSILMSDINNEISMNEAYRNNIKKLHSMVLVKFDNDTVVRPRESEWFGFYKPGQETEIQRLEQSDIYLEDRIGIKELHEEGRLYFLSVPGNHLQFNETWFVDKIIKAYLM